METVEAVLTAEQMAALLALGVKLEGAILLVGGLLLLLFGVRWYRGD